MSSEFPRSRKVLPEELIFYIFTLLLEDPCPISSVHLLLVSRRIYNWALPKFYHSLNLASMDDTCPKDGIQRASLIEQAPSTSLLLIKNLQCGALHEGYSFSPFKNLKRLSLWGRSLFRVPLTYTLMNLCLEELFVANRYDLSMLAGAIECWQIPSAMPLRKSLRKLGSRCCLGQKVIDAFPYITHVVMECNVETLKEEAQELVFSLLAREQIRCCVLYSGVYAPRLSKKDVHPNEVPLRLQDHRLVCVRSRMRHLQNLPAGSGFEFWGEQARMWKEAEKAVCENPKVKVCQYHSKLQVVPLLMQL
ncbi:hypothetical protein DL96DRAFT_1821530 [Flagelloscypha sp. PMI_526]|nr:hypothetical protein DL96DRAFT_1821530 [Flagelloscypha sp. PMI_526]